MIRAPIAAPSRDFDPIAQRIALPWPPSVNRYWRTVTSVRQGQRTVRLEHPRHLISAAGRAYRDEAAWRVKVARLRAYEAGEEVIARLLWYLPDRRQRDLDNLPKAVFDALAAGGLLTNDRQIRRSWSVFIEPETGRPSGVRIDLARLV